MQIIELELSRSLYVDLNSALNSLHCVDMDSVSDVLEVHAASIFRVEVCKVGEFLETSTRCEHPRADRQYKSSV
jgi:hypothetical protein